MNVDQLRLNIEQLPPAAQDLSYYEKWSVSMLNHLRRTGAIDPAAYGRFIAASSPSDTEGRGPRFAPGDRVIVREQEGGEHNSIRISLFLMRCRATPNSAVI